MHSAQCRVKFKGPPSVPEWTFGPLEAWKHDNKARPRFHRVYTVSNVARATLWGSHLKYIKVSSVKCESVQIQGWVPRVQAECGVPSVHFSCKVDCGGRSVKCEE